MTHLFLRYVYRLTDMEAMIGLLYPSPRRLETARSVLDFERTPNRALK